VPTSSAPTPFDAVIFDCDGVLVDSEALALDIELEELAALGLVYGRDQFCARFLGMNNKDFYAALHSDRLERTGEGLPQSFITAQRERMFAACHDRLGEVPGAASAVAACPLDKAVASSSGAQLLRVKLEATGLWSAFAPQIYSGDMVERGKPAPDIFRLAANGLGHAPERCLVIEDSENGVRAARAAGATAWGFTGGGHMGPRDASRLLHAGAERVLHGWHEARALFEGWNRPLAGAA
jgi:beta-phosphoglucomutase-like phosphatase (HAD superfamily)